ncbi:MAG: CRISPR-associated endonuclease Cas2 [Candidatus Liptonbacteria bacterium]|nr:CRISPR-associated endonuclease Cas2 [Candidatus Liptonbacteria bacterium]
MKKVKKDAALKLLEILADTAMATGDVLEAMIKAGYGASQGRLLRELSRMERRRELAEARVRVGRNYCTLLSRLKKDGLVQVRPGRGDKLLAITRQGLQRLRELWKKQSQSLPTITQPAIASRTFTIVAFDIPEKERRKRNWLRRVLANLGLRMIQKSVWIGKVVLPREFLESLRDLELLDRVEIFEISKAGTLEHIV